MGALYKTNRNQCGFGVMQLHKLANVIISMCKSNVLEQINAHLKRYIPYSGKFSPGKFFAKARANVLRKKFAIFIFAQPGLGEINFQSNLYLTPYKLHSQHAKQN